MNIEKLTSKDFFEKLDKQIVDEEISEILEISDELIKLSNNKTINYCLGKKKGAKEKPTARVLNNWINSGIVQIDNKDRGKIKRFNVLESIWLNILVELRDFGISIESIKRTRKTLFDYKVENFSLFKFHIINSIIREEQTLVVFKNGEAQIMSTDTYLLFLYKNKFESHLSFRLIDFIIPEFSNHALNKNILISNPFENIQKMKLLFLLKTGCFQHLKIRLSGQDVRYIENSEMITKNIDVASAISNWNFETIVVSIDNDVETIITL